MDLSVSRLNYLPTFLQTHVTNTSLAQAATSSSNDDNDVNVNELNACQTVCNNR